MSLIDPGFDHTVLSEFRSRLIEGGAERLLLDTLLQRLRDHGLVKAKGRQRTDSTHVLAAVRGLNRLERVGETARAALNELAVVAPDWLQALAPPVWYERYSRRVENYRLPKAEKERLELAATIGADGDQLLAAIDAAIEQPWLAQLPAIHVLREVWTTQYIKEDGQLRWRTVQERPATAEQISSPYDPEARYGKKRDISWTGYRAHLTETCDPETPHVITNVETTLATTPDDHMLPIVHQSLAKSELLPSEHLVDMGYTGCRMLVDSQQRHGVVIVGPVVEDTSWQAHAAEGFSKADFHVDWIFVGHNKMRIFQEEIFGPVLSVTTFKTVEDAIAIGNDTIYGLGAGVWSRNGTVAYRVGREIKAGRVWTNCYHMYPAHAAFGGYKHSGYGRETHKMIMDHYQQTKNLLVSYSPNALGFF